VTQKVSFKLVA